MHVKERHIIHSIVHGKVKIKKALLVLFNNNKLVGQPGHQGILLVKKIKSHQNFNEQEWATARQVIRFHAMSLAQLANKNLFNI